MYISKKESIKLSHGLNIGAFGIGFASGIASKFLLKMSGIKDLVSKNSQTDTSAGATGYLDASNTYVSVAATEPLIDQRGNTSHPGFEQFLTTPLSPANQTTASLGAGEYFLWILGGGSVAVSANSATITGAGSATEATGVNFQVTAAGTVDIAITGECTHFQLTDGAVSLYPIFYDSVAIVPSRAGTTKLADIDTDFSKFRDSLRGEADGVEVWNLGDIGPGETLSIEDIGSSIGDRYRVSAFLDNIPDTPVRLINQYFTYSSFSTNVLASTAGWTTEDIVADAASGVGVKNLSTNATVSNYSLQKISPAAAKHTFTWTPGHDYDIAGAAAGILLKSGNFEIGYTATGGVTLTDGTNTATVTGVNWASGDDIAIAAVYGPDTAESAQKMQLTVDASFSALTACLDTMGPDTDFVWGDTGTTVQNGVSDYIVEKLQQSYWRS